jgi:hypothetical protein
MIVAVGVKAGSAGSGTKRETCRKIKEREKKQNGECASVSLELSKKCDI